MAYRKELSEDLMFDNKLLQKLRVMNGMTQNDLANKFNINLQTLIKWENGYTKPRLFDTYRLSKMFGVKIEDFIIDKGE